MLDFGQYIIENKMPKKILVGKIKNLIDDKTAKVEVSQFISHPKYKKIIKRTKNYLVDIKNIATKPDVNDNVSIEETVPVSKRKRFTVKEVLK